MVPKQETQHLALSPYALRDYATKNDQYPLRKVLKLHVNETNHRRSGMTVMRVRMPIINLYDQYCL